MNLNWMHITGSFYMVGMFAPPANRTALLASSEIYVPIGIRQKAMYTNNRDTYRQAFFTTWEKHLKKLPLEPIEAQILEIVLLHPEYHRFLQKSKSNEKQEFSMEENPFMHMSLHLAIRDQIKLNKPMGMAEIYRNLITEIESDHEAEHALMQALKVALIHAQETGIPMSEDAYLDLARSSSQTTR